MGCPPPSEGIHRYVSSLCHSCGIFMSTFYIYLVQDHSSRTFDLQCGCQVLLIPLLALCLDSELASGFYAYVCVEDVCCSTSAYTDKTQLLMSGYLPSDLCLNYRILMSEFSALVKVC